MSDIIGPDGRPLDDGLVTPGTYIQNLAGRAGVTKAAQEFLRRNPLDLPDIDPVMMSRSQRQLFAAKELLAKSSVDIMHLWVLIAALTEHAGGEVTFSREALEKFIAPQTWPVVTPDADQNVTVKLGVFKDVKRASK